MITLEKIQEFEIGLDPLHIDRSKIPAKVLGYGEISTVFQINGDKSTACKRMPLFSDRSSTEKYAHNYEEYCQLLQRAGLKLPLDRTEIVEVPNRPVVFYILQEQLPPDRFCHKLVHSLNSNEVEQMIERVAGEISKVWIFNESNAPSRKLAIDGQLSNWVFTGEVNVGDIHYIDTSTPLYRKNGTEQLDPELFLKSAPSFLRWIIRWLFLQDVMNRYYDPRLVYTDLVANLYKEQRSDLVPLAVEIVNRSLSGEIEPLSVEEVEKYYKEDKFIWMLFLVFRRMDRWFKTKLLHQRYEFILPGKIKR